MSSSDTKMEANMEPFLQDVRDVEDGAFHEVQNQSAVLQRASLVPFQLVSSRVTLGLNWVVQLKHPCTIEVHLASYTNSSRFRYSTGSLALSINSLK